MGQKRGCSEPYGYWCPKDDLDVLWQLKSTGIKGIMVLNLMKVFDKILSKLKAIMKEM